MFGNPLFEQLQDYVPAKIWADYENDIRILEGPFTGDLAFEIQVGLASFCANCYLFSVALAQNQVNPGETLGLVMISSDATLLTNISGDKKAHCVYMSCANIRKGCAIEGFRAMLDESRRDPRRDVQ